MSARSHQINLRLDDAAIEVIDDVRRGYKNPPTRTEAAKMIFFRALSDHLWNKEDKHVSAA